MGLLSEVKCANCDKRYSGLRSRCPFCGARRIGRGKYSGEPDENKGKMIIGILILAVLVVAVAVLVLTTEAPEPEVSDSPSPPPTSTIPDEDSVDQLPGNNEEPIYTPPETTPTEEETPPEPAVTSIYIAYQGNKRTDITMKTTDGRLPLSAKITPDDADIKIEWSSSKPEVFEVVPDDTTGRTVKLTAIGAGTATLTVTAGDQTAECIVRVNKG